MGVGRRSKVPTGRRSGWACFAATTLIGGAALLRRKLPLVGNFFYAPRGPLLEDWTDEAALTTLLDAIRHRAAEDDAAFLKIDPAVPIERTDVTALLATARLRAAARLRRAGLRRDAAALRHAA